MRNGHGRHSGRTFLRNLSAQSGRVAERVQELGHAALTRAERAVTRLGEAREEEGPDLRHGPPDRIGHDGDRARSRGRVHPAPPAESGLAP